MTGDELTLPVSSRFVALTLVHTDHLPPPITKLTQALFSKLLRKTDN